MTFKNKIVICRECSRKFVFRKGEQKFYIKKGYKYPPKRCKMCRSDRTQENKESFTVLMSWGIERSLPLSDR